MVLKIVHFFVRIFIRVHLVRGVALADGFQLVVNLKTTQQSSVVCDDVVREYFDSEESSAVFPIEKLKLAFDHDIELLKHERIEVSLNFLFALSLLKLFEIFGRHAYKPELALLSNLPISAVPCSLAKFT